MLLFLLAVGCRNDSTIKTFNSPPTIEITSHSNGDVVVEATPVELIAAPSDPNHQTDELEVAWTVNGDVLCPRAAVNDNESRCTIEPFGDAADIRATVYDPENASEEARVVLDVRPSDPPTAVILEPLSDIRYYSDELVSFRATVSDAEDPPATLDIEWTSSLEGALAISSTSDSSGNYADFTNLGEGNHGITLSVTDSSNKITQTSATVTVGPPNSAPTCNITEPTDGDQVVLGSVVTLASTVDDVDVGPEGLTINWTSDIDGALCTDNADSNGEQSCETTTLSSGNHDLRLTVEDERGLGCTAEITVTVSSPPVLTVISPTSNTVHNEGELTTLEIAVSDAEDASENLTLSAVDSIESTITVTQPDSLGRSTTVLSGWATGTHLLSLSVTDTDGLTTTENLNLIVNGLPTAPTLSFLPSVAFTDDALQVVASGSNDPEGQALTTSHQWLRDGITTLYVSDTIPASATSKGELWTSIVSMSDGYGNSPSASLSTTIQNSPPEIATITIAPSSQVTSQAVLACAAAATDADGDPLTSTYEWIDGSGVILGSGPSLTLSPNVIQPGDSVGCTVTVYDGDGGTDTDGASVTVINSPPSILTLDISPDPATTVDVLVATVTTEDLDNQAVSVAYDWQINGISQASAPSLNNSLFQRGDLIVLTATPNDGSVDGNSQSVSITVANSPPTAPVIEITPIDPVEGLDDLLCSVIVDGTDADADTVSYDYGWTVDGQASQITTDTVSASDMLAGEVWTCVVTPTDGIDSGISGTSSVQIRSDCSSLELDGSGDGLIIGEQENLLGVTSSFSISAWIYLDSGYTQAGMGIFDGESTNSSDPLRNSGYGLRVEDGQLALFFGTGTLSNSWWQSGVPLPTNQWVHVAGTRASNVLTLYVNGQAIYTVNNITIEPINYDGVDYDHNRYQIGMLDPNGLNGVHFDFMGRIRNVGVWARALSDAEVSQLAAVDFDSGLFGMVGHWAIDEGTGQTALESSAGLDASIEGNPVWVESCPFQDADNDGYNAMLDCDDSDPNVQTPDGSSASCAGLSCLWIENSGFAQGNGLYWLDPDGTGAFEAYCDMSTDGGGWTLILKAVNGNFAYEDDIWTTDNTVNPTDYQLTATGMAKYPAFNSVAFTEIRTSDIAALSNDFTHQFNSNYSSALELFSGSGIAINNGLQAYFNNISEPDNQSWGCSQYQRFGFNQMDYLGISDVGGGGSCDWNGGARWGQRVNANHGGTGNHSGQGWGAYSTICYPWRQQQYSDPLCTQGVFDISQLLWVR